MVAPSPVVAPSLDTAVILAGSVDGEGQGGGGDLVGAVRVVSKNFWCSGGDVGLLGHVGGSSESATLLGHVRLLVLLLAPTVLRSLVNVQLLVEGGRRVASFLVLGVGRGREGNHVARGRLEGRSGPIG